jgi:hypothetical protein
MDIARGSEENGFDLTTGYREKQGKAQRIFILSAAAQPPLPPTLYPLPSTLCPLLLGRGVTECRKPGKYIQDKWHVGTVACPGQPQPRQTS